MNTPGKTVGSTFQQPLGRWPANVIHDGSDEVTDLFPDRKTTWVSNGHAQNRGGDFLGALSHSGPQGFNDSGSAARFFYTAKASRQEREAGLEGAAVGGWAAKGNGTNRVCARCGAPQLRPQECACEIKEWVQKPARNPHPTVKPIALTTYLARLLLPPAGGRMLVPFAGVGSEMIGAALAGWPASVGIEIDPEYARIARARIRHWTSRGPLFDEDPT